MGSGFLTGISCVKSYLVMCLIVWSMEAMTQLIIEATVAPEAL